MDRNPIQALDRIIASLRGENGCPWDKKQTPGSIGLYLIEEAHELLDAIESADPEDICEELGDVLFQVLFIARLFEEKGLFSIEAAARKSAEKMIRRHPHVFGEVTLTETEEVRQQWHEIKKQEKNGRKEGGSVLDSVPRTMPALMRAYRISERAARTGFDWDDIAGVMGKAEEEWRELKGEIGNTGTREALPEADRDQEKTAMEFGDVLFTLVNVARFARIHPETALARATRKFEERFHHLERAAAESGRDIDAVPREEKERLWNEAKEM
ncbi:nucleoside triphosphate pyrophosphohydrolase [Desulfococcus sp.]|uniref:nucleoside triphosphate pyrophosphohydrolase n=1 Tax=Desulfococcus sp. TaxID=2025834 RepID=UPI0035932CD8